MMKKHFLLIFPDAPIKVDGVCPMCGHYLTAKLCLGKIYLVCKNPFCSYFKKIEFSPTEEDDYKYRVQDK
jgi:hypothetical protein